MKIQVGYKDSSEIQVKVSSNSSKILVNSGNPSKNSSEILGVLDIQAKTK